LRAAKPGETFLFSPSGGEATRRCHIEEFDLTAHANREELLDFVGTVQPRAVLLTHGDSDARVWFQEKIQVRYPNVKVIQPQPGGTVEV
jgi:Cft2 family RNA processing exonuclease